MPVTLKTIAAEAGVSVMAVSAVLNHTRSTRVSAATSEKILQVARKLGYRPNLTARGLRSKTSYLIGVLVWKMSGNVTGPVLDGIDQALTDAGYGMLASSYNSLDMLRSKIDVMLARDVDGVILPGESQADYLAEFARLLKGRPAICIGSRITGSSLPWVSTDKVIAAQNAFRHLYNLGHRNFLLLGNRQEYCKNFIKNAEESGCTVIHLPEAKSFNDGIEIGTALASGKYKVSAAVAYNDENAAGVIKSLQQHNCRIPQDFSVIGYNNLPLAAMTNPAITTIENPGFASGQSAVQILMEMIANKDVPEPISIKPQLIIRESTGFFSK